MDDATAPQLGELVLDVDLLVGEELDELRALKLPAEHRRHLGDPLGGGREAIQARRDDLAHRPGNEDLVHRTGQPHAAVVHGEESFLDQRAGDLLREERAALGLGEDARLELVRQCAAAEGAGDAQHVGLEQRPQMHLRHRRLGAPLRAVFRPVADQHQHLRATEAVHHHLEQFLRGLVDPVQVLEDHHHRCATALGGHELGDRLERLALQPFEREVGGQRGRARRGRGTTADRRRPPSPSPYRGAPPPCGRRCPRRRPRTGRSTAAAWRRTGRAESTD